MSVGRVVAGKFALLEELGRGGMGSVWVAEHLELGSRVAVKLIDPRLVGSGESLARFAREAQAAATLSGPNVVRIFDHGVDGDTPYIAMELLEGESLASRLARRRRLGLAELWSLMRQLGQAMTRAHQAGIVHRDLKPDNIFLVSGPGEPLVKVLDFGVAKALRAAEQDGIFIQTEAGTFLGTPHYVSPEQAQGRPVDARSDLWAMAVVAFECLTGRRPFESTSIRELIDKVCRAPIVVPSTVAKVPPGFDSWFARATQRDPDLRFQTAAELVDALYQVLEPALADRAQGPGEDLEPERASGVFSGTSMDAYPPGTQLERRGEVRRPSWIPAGIDGERDLMHIALLQNVSRSGALLATRARCQAGTELTLNLHTTEGGIQHNVQARVVRVARRPPERAELWRYDVGVQFRSLLPKAVLEAIVTEPDQSEE